MMLFTRIAPLLVIAAISSCDGAARGAAQAAVDSAAARAADSLARARQDSINRATPGYVIDSLLPIDEEIRRFHSAVDGTAVTALGNASPTRDSLFSRFVRALETRDTAAFQAMHVTAREFIDLIYPESPYTRPPYRQSPRIRWALMEVSTSQGLNRLLARRGGKPLGALGMSCARTPSRQGKNLVWSDCTVRIRNPDGSEHREQLFASIIERDGRFKFLSYANQY